MKNDSVSMPIFPNSGTHSHMRIRRRSAAHGHTRTTHSPIGECGDNERREDKIGHWERGEVGRSSRNRAFKGGDRCMIENVVPEDEERRSKAESPRIVGLPD
jgi:hypothetical protein